MIFRIALFAGVLLATAGCAVLHHVQLGSIDNRNDFVAVPFEVMVSETGVSTEEIGQIAKATNSKAGDSVKGVADIVGLFQIGPRTGMPVYNEHYADRLIDLIYRECPSGRVTGLMSIREMRKYPVISGEIVKITGTCLKPRTTALNSLKREGTTR